MRVDSISTVTCVQPRFKASTSSVQTKPLQNAVTEKCEAVMSYIENGCQKTEEGWQVFNKLFVPEIYDLYRMCLPVKDILAKCGDNIEVIDRTLGKYGLELYAGLPQGSTIKNAREGIVETGYWSKYDDLNTNFINYLAYNPSGNLEELRERFGSQATMWLGRHETTGQISTGLFSYKVNNDLVDTSSVELEAQTLRANAIRRYLDRNK